jgi:DNA polymerase-1
LYYTRKLKPIFLDMLRKDKGVKRVFDYILMPLSKLYTEAEYDGVCVNIEKFGDAEKHLRKEFSAAERSLKKWGDINWGSTKQLSELLFNKLGLDVIEVTAAGNASCNESVLNQLDHPCVIDLLKLRHAKQQLSFFIEGWKPYLHKRRVNGRWYYFLHPTFKIHGTVTGRPSAEHPNLMQVPRDSLIRSLITGYEDWELIDCDLSQIELRIAAFLADERTMIETFQNGKDAHWVTAIRELERGGGGDYVDTVIRTAQLYFMSLHIPANGTSAEILLRLWGQNSQREKYESTHTIGQ